MELQHTKIHRKVLDTSVSEDTQRYQRTNHAYKVLLLSQGGGITKQQGPSLRLLSSVGESVFVIIGIGGLPGDIMAPVEACIVTGMPRILRDH